MSKYKTSHLIHINSSRHHHIHQNLALVVALHRLAAGKVDTLAIALANNVAGLASLVLAVGIGIGNAVGAVQVRALDVQGVEGVAVVC